MLRKMSYVFIDNLSSCLDMQLFQISAMYTCVSMYDKKMALKTDNVFVNNSGMFDDYRHFIMEEFCEIYDNEMNGFRIIPYGLNIMLRGSFKTWKYCNENTIEFIRKFMFSNEDYMFEAYEQYNKIKEYFDIIDDNLMTSIYIENDYNMEYYSQAITIMNKKNIVLFSPKHIGLLKDMMHKNDINEFEYNIYAYWNDNIYVRFILLCFFQNNIIHYSNPYLSLWSSYISQYSNKTVICPEYISDIMNEKINNMNEMNVVYISD
jgi:hypothetical protein